jgi:hypothetical protein
MSCDSDGTPESINRILQRTEMSRWNDATSINIPTEQLQSKFNYQPLVERGYTNMSCDSDGTPESINGILQRNETSRRWNDAPSINIPMEQLPPFREKKSYTQVFEFGNSLCPQPQLSPLQERATTRVTLYTPTKCAIGNTEESSPNLNSSQWQKFQMSPISSDDSPEVYY